VADDLIDLIERSLDLTVIAAAVTPVKHPHSTGWRSAPELIVAQPSDGARGRLEIEGGPTVIVRDGDAFCVPCGIRHRSTLITPKGISRWAHVAFRALGGIDPLALLEPVFLIPMPQGARVGAICTELAALAQPPAGLATVARRHALGFELLALVAERTRPLPGALARANALRRLAPAIALIERSLAQGGPSVPALARAADVSRSRLHALFQAALGVSPLQHVLSTRIATACRFLLGSDLPIAEIAARSGFGDAFHFSRMFRRSVGMSPTAYRARGFESAL
jgi:AraC-like DNA-binding protein